MSLWRGRIGLVLTLHKLQLRHFSGTAMSDNGRLQRILRYSYPGSTQRNGRVVLLAPQSPQYEVPDSTLTDNVFNCLQRDGVDLDRWNVRIYDTDLGGFRRLSRPSVDALNVVRKSSQSGQISTFDDHLIPESAWRLLDPPSRREGDGRSSSDQPTRVERRRLDITLESRPTQPKEGCMARPDDVISAVQADEQPKASHVSRAAPAPGTQNGYFGIGICGGKTSENLGTLWRSAWQLGASYCFVIGSRFKKMAGDTTKTWRQIPMYEHKDWGEFAAARPFQAEWVAVEMGGTPIEEFRHPDRAVYILGSEDNGLNSSVLNACSHHVSLPTSLGRSPSLNVAVTGSLILYDREMKRQAKLAKESSRVQKRHRNNTTPQTQLCSDGDGGRHGVDSVKPKQLRNLRKSIE